MLAGRILYLLLLLRLLARLDTVAVLVGRDSNIAGVRRFCRLLLLLITSRSRSKNSDRCLFVAGSNAGLDWVSYLLLLLLLIQEYLTVASTACCSRLL